MINPFATDPDVQIERTRARTSWGGSGSEYNAHEELVWPDGPGPTYSLAKSQEMIQNRYDNISNNLRLTIPMLQASERFSEVGSTLRAQGWRDWHILLAAFNVTLNYRQSTPGGVGNVSELKTAIIEASNKAEDGQEPPVPVGMFNPVAMDRMRQNAMLASLENWGLELHQSTPDIHGIERLLVTRFGYWEDDVPHEDPFRSRGESQGDGAIIVIRDTTQQDD